MSFIIHNKYQIKDLIIKKMQKFDITTYRLAKDTGITESTLSKYFNGKHTLGLDKIIIITKELGIEINIKIN